MLQSTSSLQAATITTLLKMVLAVQQQQVLMIRVLSAAVGTEREREGSKGRMRT